MEPRRQWLERVGRGLSATALVGLLAEESAGSPLDPLAPKAPHFPASADCVIFLYATGGVSHVDTFDFKPALVADHGKKVTASRWLNKPGAFERYLIKPRWAFRQYGQSGAWVSDLFPCLGALADDLCILNAMHCDSDGHDKGTLAAHCGSAQFARPSHGAWVSYGLGTENRNLPSFVVVAPAAPYAGAQTWGSDFLPGCHQGTHVLPGAEPLPNLVPRVATPGVQRLELDLLARLNAAHAERHPGADALAARMEGYELAFRMQMEVPGILDLSKEDAATRELYGIGADATDAFGRKCLLARRLVERGVRFVQLYHGTWDSHDYIERAHGNLVRAVDRPIAALIADLKRRGLLDSTLVVWCGEFGRTPDNGVRGGTAYGRDHNPKAMTIWLAGGGCKAGTTLGMTDDLGMAAVEGIAHVRDFHVTLLKLLGLDDNKLTYYHAGRFKQLSQFGGTAIKGLIA